MRTSLNAFCSRFAVRSADSMCLLSKRGVSHRDAATVFKDIANVGEIRKRSAVS